MDSQASPSPFPAFPPLEDVLSDANHWFRQVCDRCDTAVRERPRQSLLLAFGLGTLTRRLPIPEMIGAALRAACAAAPPTLAVLGACALVERIRRLNETPHAARPPRSLDRPDDFPLESESSIIFPDSTPPPAAPPVNKVA